MPHVIAVASLKGGAGKTTIATNLAAALHLSKHRTLLVDADPQGTSMQWGEVAASAGVDGPPVVAMKGAGLRENVHRVGEGYDVVVIDAPPRLGAEQKAAMLAAHLVLLPVTPGGADLWALGQTLEVLEDVRALRPDLKAAIVTNRVDSRTAFSRQLLEALKKESTVPTLKASLGQRVAYAEALTAGHGVLSYPGASPPARKEMQALAREVLRLLGSAR